MSPAKWKYIGFSNCVKKCIQSSLNNAANYTRLYVTTAYLGLSLPCCNEVAYPLQRCRTGLHSPVIFHSRSGSCCNKLIAGWWADTWTRLKHNQKGKKRKSKALHFKISDVIGRCHASHFTFQLLNSVLPTRKMLNYGATLASFFVQSNKIDSRASLFKLQSKKKKKISEKNFSNCNPKKVKIWEENLSHCYKKKLFNSK